MDNSRKTGLLKARVPAALVAEFDTEAAERGVPVAVIIREAAESHVARRLARARRRK